MRRRTLFVSVLIVVAGTTLMSAGRERLAAEQPGPADIGQPHLTQRSGGPGPAQNRGLRGWWGRRTSEHLKTHSSVRSAYRGATDSMAKATAEVLGDGEVVALGTIVDANGYIVTKASLLEGKISCRLHGGQELEATLKGVSDEYDLALLKVEATDLVAAAWRTEPVKPGILVAAVAPDGDAIGIGVVSAELRAVGGSRRSNPRRGWLGVSLGDGDSGVGVTEVIEGSAAAKAGLNPGDQIQTIDGRPMQSMEQVVELVGSHPPGTTLSIEILRDGQPVKVSATLQKPPRNAAPEDQWGGGPFSDRRAGFPPVLPHDTVILPSQCGGPLVDTDGKVVGVNIARALRVTTYAIPADRVQQLVSQLK
ncbi:MAG: S1C family serine protease [Pirellulaceae bacterium]